MNKLQKRIVTYALRHLIDEVEPLHQAATSLGTAVRPLEREIGHLISLFEGEWGCHCDLEEGMEPDDCVLNNGDLDDCIYSKGCKSPHDCPYWKLI